MRRPRFLGLGEVLGPTRRDRPLTTSMQLGSPLDHRLFRMQKSDRSNKTFPGIGVPIDAKKEIQ